MADDKKEIRFKYIFADDYSPIYVNGVWGGVTPKGEVNMNFFLERHPVPHSVYYEVGPDGTMGKESRRDPDESMFIRHVQTGVVMNYGDAKAIHKWLGEQLQILEKRFKIVTIDEEVNQNVKQ